MPQAMERLLATPNTMPRLPAINLAASAIDPPVPEMTALYMREAPGPEGFSTLLHPSPTGRVADSLLSAGWGDWHSENWCRRPPPRRRLISIRYASLLEREGAAGAP